MTLIIVVKMCHQSRIYLIKGNTIGVWQHLYICFETDLVLIALFWFSQQKTSKPLEKLKTAHLLFDELVQISQKLNSTFSIQILLYLVFSFVVVTTHLFFAITDATNANIALAALLFFVGFIFIILTAADLPVEEVSSYQCI